jgi:hypothetical protein
MVPIPIDRPSTKPAYKGILYEQEAVDDFGLPILKKVSDNTVVLGGAIRSLEQITGTVASYKPDSLNRIMSYNDEPDVSFSNLMKSFICLFGVGMGGSELEFGSVKDPTVRQKEIMTMIPIRHGTALSGPDASKYYFAKPDANGIDTTWYLKEFDTPPVIASHWKDSVEEETDGTKIEGDISNSAKTAGIESFAEFKLILRPDDVREYFEKIGDLKKSRYNSLGLFTGFKNGDDYTNIHLFSVTNFENRSVATRQESTYFYRLYALV